MKFRDNKKFRNCRRWRELDAARDKRENLIGEPTGYSDADGLPILTGDLVRINGGRDYSEDQIVLFCRNRNAYCVHRGCWYDERNPFDPRCYGKIDYTFKGKPRKLVELNIIRHAKEVTS